MRFVEEYRDSGAVHLLAAAIQRRTTRPWTIMEICGGQTHSIVRHGLDQLLPSEITLVHGPGCPVCVTPVALIDKALEIASQPGVLFTTFGDMLRVPGSAGDLQSAKASGADVRIVYTPLDAVRLAHELPEREVVFFAVGFETTAPVNALAVEQARRLGLKNFSVLVSQVLVPPAMEAILRSPASRVQAFLAAGHVCTVTGYQEYELLAARYRVPIIVTGFEPLDLLQGVLLAIEQLEGGRYIVENQYSRVVRREGNSQALALMSRVFRVVDREWRGIGVIPASGLGLSEEYRPFDAEARFGPARPAVDMSGECISGLILQGIMKPEQCPAFGLRCTPERPLGATMVSSEGACAAYFHYRRHVAAPAPSQGAPDA